MEPIKILEITMRIIAAFAFFYSFHILMGQVKVESVFKNRERVRLCCYIITSVAAGIVIYVCHAEQYQVYLMNHALFVAGIILFIITIVSTRAGWHGDYKNKTYFSYSEEETMQMKTNTSIDASFPDGYTVDNMCQIGDHFFVGNIDIRKGQSVVIEANPLDKENNIYTVESVFDKKHKIAFYEILMWIHLATMAVGVAFIDREYIINSLTPETCLGMSLGCISFLITIRVFGVQDAQENTKFISRVIQRLIQSFFLILYVLCVYVIWTDFFF